MGRAISWTNRAKCPPIEDCPVKNTVRKGKPTAKQAREARQLFATQKAARRAARGKGAEPEPKKAMWPFAGSFDPKRERGR